MKCEPKFALTLKQTQGLWGCLGNWLPVQWMGKWAWSRQGFVGRWERRQAIGTQHMFHEGSTLMLWQRCWTSSVRRNLRRVTATHSRAAVACLSWTADGGLWTHQDQGRTPRGGEEDFVLQLLVDPSLLTVCVKYATSGLSCPVNSPPVTPYKIGYI